MHEIKIIFWENFKNYFLGKLELLIIIDQFDIQSIKSSDRINFDCCLQFYLFD